MKTEVTKMSTLYVNTKETAGHINPELQGHFSEHLGRCIYGGLYVGENSDIPNTNGMRNDVVNALKEMKVPVLRWPGGCFADEYHWKDGIGPKENRKKMVNTNWGGVVEDNSFGTHEYMELCRQLGCKTYINGNVGSGTVREMSEWIEYMTFDGVSPMADERKANGSEKPWRVDYFGVGNENWGCGGNMIPEYYANLFRQYQSYIKIYDPEKPICKIACGANDFDYNWTEKVFEGCAKGSGSWPQNHLFMNGISLHYYTLPGDWDIKGSATDFDEKDWYRTLRKTYCMDELLTKHSAIMDRYDKECRIGLMVDEWGTWYDVEEGTNPGFLYQQNTMRDALVAGINLNIFNKHCNRVKMANIAQLVNVLQAPILTEGDRMVLTPTYHVFRMYNVHQGAELLASTMDTKKVGLEEENMVQNMNESASLSEDGTVNITLTNLDLNEANELKIVLEGMTDVKAEAEIVTGGMRECNTFDEPDRIAAKSFTGLTVSGNVITLTVPARSVMRISVKE